MKPSDLLYINVYFSSSTSYLVFKLNLKLYLRIYVVCICNTTDRLTKSIKFSIGFCGRAINAFIIINRRKCDG